MRVIKLNTILLGKKLDILKNVDWKHDLCSNSYSSHLANCWRTFRRQFHLTSDRDGFANRNILSLKSRGLVGDIFPNEQETQLLNLCNGKPQTIYAGFDPTADSLHVGHLAVITTMINCLRGGHHVIALIGGATAMIGDPSGKNTERPFLDSDTIAENAVKLSENLKRLFKNHENLLWDSKNKKESLNSLKIVNNMEWYQNMNCLELIGRIGRHMRVGPMLSRHSVQSRLTSEVGISFTEFTYQLFQAYDWVHLCQSHNCLVQIGGGDQMGNIVSGHDLVSRMLNQKVYGITVPLVVSDTGDKYGKTAGNAIWLDSQKTSPFDLYQFFVRTKDSEVEKLLNIFTFKSEHEIKSIVAKHMNSPNKQSGQKELAKEVTTLVHGKQGLEMAETLTKALYMDNIDALSTLNPEDIFKNIGEDSAAVGMVQLYLDPGTTLMSMAMKAGCFKDENDARRIINNGGFYINYQKSTNHDEILVPGIHILQNQVTLARVGKKNYYVIKWKM